MKKIIISLIIISIFLTSTAQATSYYIHVNTKKCKIQIYEQVNKEWKLIDSKKCCVGRNGKTPKGEFKIKSKEKSFKHDDKYYDYVSYFYKKYAFHSTPRTNSHYDNSSLGRKKSNGCVRVSPEVAKWIYKYCKRGTRVVIE